LAFTDIFPINDWTIGRLPITIAPLMILCALMIVKWAEWSCEDGKASSMRNVYVSNHADFSIQLAIPHSKSYYIPYMNFSHHKVPGMHPLDLSFLPGVYFSQ